MKLRPPRFRAAYLLWPGALLLFWLALKDVPMAETAVVLRRLGPGQAAVIVAANLGVLTMLNGRWWAILRAQGYRAPLLGLLPIRMAAFSVSYLTPGSHLGGEPLQGLLASRRYAVPLPTAAASIVLERGIEVLVNSAAVALGVLVIAALGWLPGRTAWVLAAAASVLLAAPAAYGLALWNGRRPIAWAVEHISAFKRFGWTAVARGVGQAETQVAEFLRHQPAGLAAALAFSAASWAGLVGEFWLMLHFLGLRLGPVEMLGSLAAARLAILIPVPGALGALEASQIAAISLAGLRPADGAALALLIRGRDVAFAVAGLAIGAWMLRRGRH